MDPVSLYIIGGTAVAGLASLIALLLRRRGSPPALPPPSVTEEIPPPEESLPDESPQEQDAQMAPPQPVVVEPPKPPGMSVREIIEKILSHVSFSAKRVQVGFETRQGKSLGVEEVETAYPSDGIHIRRMTDLSELPNLHIEDMLLDDDSFYDRLATGDLRVSVPIERREVFEEVHEPVWEEKRRILYVLFDVSPSMFPSDGPSWRERVWRPLNVALLDHAIGNEAFFLGREFSGGVGELLRAIGPDQAAQLRSRVERPWKGSGTDIGYALRMAIADFQSEEYDQGEIVIVTDGEDNGGLAPTSAREKLDNAGLKLHAILLGVENDGLRACADHFQIIEYLGQDRYQLHELETN